MTDLLRGHGSVAFKKSRNADLFAEARALRETLQSWLTEPAYQEVVGAAKQLERELRRPASSWRRELRSLVSGYSATAIRMALGRLDPVESKFYRRAERLAGLKLESLWETLDSIADEEHPELAILVRPLKGYLAIRRRRSSEEALSRRQSFYTTLFDAMAEDHDPQFSSRDDAALRSSLYTVARLSLAGSSALLRTEANDNVCSLVRALPKEASSYVYPQIPLEGRTYVQGLLGRYDALLLAEARPMCRCPLPFFEGDSRQCSDVPDPEEAYTECFPSFFVRRELAVPLRLRRGVWDGDFKTAPVIGVLALVYSAVLIA